MVSAMCPPALAFSALDTSSPEDRLAKAFNAAHTAMGVEPILTVDDLRDDPDDVDERAVVAYLSLLLMFAEASRLEQLAAAVASSVATEAADRAPPAAADAAGGGQADTNTILMCPSPERLLPVALPVSADGLFLLDQLTPFPSEVDLLSHRLPSLSPLAGACVTCVACFVFVFLFVCL